ncbi:hypothetical protein BGZ60DRAFT_492165 [Tricladium varicosporioides]|nr:hypothetical protein BGZ60DRAFT_492165 [Hymenoscyphus varicosporioides]
MSRLSVKRSEPNGLSVLISGAGIGGLITALECWRVGCNVQVFERNKHTLTHGDSFTVGPSATNGFKYWPEMQQRDDEIRYEPWLAIHHQTGERFRGPISFSEANATRSSGNAPAKGIPQYMRPQFHAMLLEQLEKIGVEIHYGHEVIDYFEDAETKRAGVVLTDGSKLDADLVVAADGVRGASWKLVAGIPVPANSSGSAIWRVAFPARLVEDDPVITERFKFLDNGNSVMEMWTGPDMMAVFWRNKDTMIWSLTHKDTGTAEESWHHYTSVEEVLAYTATIPGWPEYANRVIQATPPNTLLDWKLMWRNPRSQWTSPAGRVIQLGDAAHTFLPSSGNGATQAIEDAFSLAACIATAVAKSEGKPTDIIPDATRVHNLLRFERVSCLQAFGVVNRDKRNTKSAHSDGGKKSAEKFLGRWILEHNPETYAKENYDAALAHIHHGVAFQNTNTPPGMIYKPWTIDGLLEAHERGEPTVLDGDWS